MSDLTSPQVCPINNRDAADLVNIQDNDEGHPYQHNEVRPQRINTSPGAQRIQKLLHHCSATAAKLNQQV